MTTELHLTYLCVPVMEDITPDWGRFYDTIRKLQVGCGCLAVALSAAIHANMPIEGLGPLPCKSPQAAGSVAAVFSFATAGLHTCKHIRGNPSRNA